jgi:hypothetical protein
MAEERTRLFPRIPAEALEHASNAREEIRKSVAALIPTLPPDFMTHRRAARREMLLALRSLIDGAIERVDKEGVKPPIKPVG